MNDTELDKILDTWQAPEAPRTLRHGVQAAFPKQPARRFGRPLRWVLAIGLASGVLALGMQAPADGGSWGFSLQGFHTHLQMFFDNVHRALGIQDVRVRLVNPKVEVNGKVVMELESALTAQLVRLPVPGQGRYALSLYPIEGWQPIATAAGRDTVIDFDDGGAHVKISQDSPFIPAANRTVYVYKVPMKGTNP
jgi:hypothetical protein